mmetsp:Transcript_6366/g.14076  ORF Transcript_6366/g.14076 Transcript_6366/m.14076 type:complete len:230 (+) Transcript_6366:492-1181(+)
MDCSAVESTPPSPEYVLECSNLPSTLRMLASTTSIGIWLRESKGQAVPPLCARTCTSSTLWGNCSITSQRTRSAMALAAEADSFTSVSMVMSTIEPLPTLRARMSLSPSTPSTDLTAPCICDTSCSSEASVSCFTDSKSTSRPVSVIIPAMKIPAAESATKHPGRNMAAAMENRDSTEEKASERWCHALAIRIWLLSESPTLFVMRYSHSLDAIEKAARARAGHEGTCI